MTSKSLVSIVRYEKPLESVRKVVALCRGLEHLPHKARVFIKPNIVFWTRETNFPKYGVITTSRVVEDMVVLLKEYGVDDIKYDLSLCTYCSGLTRTAFYAIAKAWQGDPWGDVGVLSGKVMQPRPGKKKTILFGKCMHQAHRDNPDISEIISIKGCPPKPAEIFKAFQQAGIQVDAKIFENIQKLPGQFFKRYEGRPEFEEHHFKIS